MLKALRPGKGKNPRTKVLANITKLPITLLLKSPKDLKDFFEEGWIDEEKENTFAHFLDIGIFKIEEQRIKIITKITKEQKELMKFFGMEEKEFINFT